MTITDPENVTEVVAHAFRVALTPPYGAVHIECMPLSQPSIRSLPSILFSRSSRLICIVLQSLWMLPSRL